MATFKNFISESESIDKDEVRRFLKLNDIHGYHIRDDGRVDIYEDYVSISIADDGPPPFKFGKIKGELHFTATYHVKSFAGGWAPELCTSLWLYANKLESLEGLENSNIEEYHLDSCKLTDLHNVHKLIPFCKNLAINFNPIKKNMLGLLKLPHLEYLEIWDNVIIKNDKFVDGESGIIYGDFEIATIIIGCHLGEKESGLVKAHRELLDHNLDDFAGL